MLEQVELHRVITCKEEKTQDSYQLDKVYEDILNRCVPPDDYDNDS